MGKSKSQKTDKKEHKLTQNEKSKFRSRKVWKDFRVRMKQLYDGIDPITLHKLYKGYKLHHMDLDASHYEDLSDESHFLPVNANSHEFLHWAYLYYKDDHGFLDRLKYYLDAMEEINSKEDK